MDIHRADLSCQLRGVDKVIARVVFQLGEQNVTAAVIVYYVSSRLLDLDRSYLRLLRRDGQFDDLSKRGRKLVAFVSLLAVLACHLGVRNKLD